MKKIGLLVGLLFVGVFAFAQDKVHNFSISYEIEDYQYREPGLMKVKSQPKQGASIVYTRRGLRSLDGDVSDDNTFASIEFRYMTGSGKYIGGTVSYDYETHVETVTPFTYDGIDDYYMELGLRLGKVYNLGQEWDIWPYFGGAWRHLTNHLEQSGPGGYKRESTYWTLPLGFNVRYHQDPFDHEYGWNVTLNAEFDWLLKGIQYSGPMPNAVTDIYDNTYNLSGNSNRQNEGYGVRGSIKVEKSLGKVGVFIEPFARYWHIQNSTIGYKLIENPDGTPTPYYIDGYYEPTNRTYEYGCKVGITF